MKKALKIAALVVVALIFIGTFVFLYQKSQPKFTVYDLLETHIDTIRRTSVVTGTIEPRNEVAIKPQITGIIAEIYKEAGQSVSKGEVIAKVKVIPDMSSLNAAESRVRLAKLNNQQAQADYNRAEKLYADRLISTEEMEKARLALHQQREELKSATDALQIAKEGVSASMADLSTTLIRSTIDGLILDIPVKVGNSVVMSNSFNDGTTIATVANMSDLIFKGSIDETEVAPLTKGMPMDISIGALPDKKFHARLEFVAPKVKTEANSTGNTFEIKGALTVGGGVTIRAGYSANAEIVLHQLAGVQALPESAVEFAGGKAYVYILTSKEGEMPQTFERRQIETGLSDGVNIEVRSGLKKGEKVRGNIQHDNNSKG